jgi:hypothetical protein
MRITYLDNESEELSVDRVEILNAGLLVKQARERIHRFIPMQVIKDVRFGIGEKIQHPGLPVSP